MASTASIRLAWPGSANNAVSTSVSDVLASPGRSPAGPARAASSSVLIKFPLWPSATPPAGVGRNVGWAFSHTDEPLVE